MALNRRLEVQQLHSGVGVPESQGAFPLVLRFSEEVLPIGHAQYAGKNLIVENEGVIEYRKRITRASYLDIEQAVCVAVAGTCENKEKKTFPVYKQVFDRPVLPDYTTPYLVFGLCAGVIVGIASSFSKALLGLI